MTFSEEFQIRRDSKDDWFDPILALDTRLFVDPFLIYNTSKAQFKHAHQKTITFFKLAFLLAAGSSKSSKDLRYRSILRMMIFPEARELCLGYASDSTSGSGSGSGFAKQITNSIYECIKLGVKNLDHFETLGLFNEGIGCDRISDMTFTLLKREFIEYTQAVCKRHNVQMREFKVSQYAFYSSIQRWDPATVFLPENPYIPGRAVILTPKSFLRELPSISADGFWDYAWSNLNQELRDQLSIEVKNGIKKAEIVQIAKDHLDWVRKFEEWLYTKPSPYDLEKDPKGLYKWAMETKSYAADNPLHFSLITNPREFERFIDLIVVEFSHFIEDKFWVSTYME